MAFDLLRLAHKQKSTRMEMTLSQMAWATKTPITTRSRVRVWPFRVLVIGAVLFLWGKLFLLTVVEGSYRRTLADQNRMTAVRTSAARGLFFDQGGEPLVINQAAYKHQVPGTAIAQAIFEPISREKALELTRVPGERIFFDVQRIYPCGRACAPIIGYMGEVTEWQLQSTEDYVAGDMIGVAGMEKTYEKEVRGTPGWETVEVDAMGNLVRVVGNEAQQAGTDVHLTIDMGLSQVLFEAMDNKPGAAVASVPQTGEILAMVSSPAYDPKEILESLKEENQPFFNRAVAGAYPPGSVFKVVVATAGLEEGTIEAESTYEDTGEIMIDEFRFGNWLFDKYGRTEGQVDIVRALQRSNDIFFYRLGEALGPNKIRDWAIMFGMERESGLTELGEVAGLIPNPDWKEKNLGEKWYLGNTYHMAIGQGDVKVTPLQINRMMGAVAAGGVLCDPVLIKNEVGKRSCHQLNLHEPTLNLLRTGLQKACEPGGTGVPFFYFSPKVACKTGTAQQGGDKDHPHAWFTAYAPVTAPEIVITVLMEKAGEGSEVAAPIAKKGLEYWFKK